MDSVLGNPDGEPELLAQLPVKKSTQHRGQEAKQ